MGRGRKLRRKSTEEFWRFMKKSRRSLKPGSLETRRIPQKRRRTR